MRTTLKAKATFRGTRTNARPNAEMRTNVRADLRSVARAQTVELLRLGGRSTSQDARNRTQRLPNMPESSSRCEKTTRAKGSGMMHGFGTSGGLTSLGHPQSCEWAKQSGHALFAPTPGTHLGRLIWACAPATHSGPALTNSGLRAPTPGTHSGRTLGAYVAAGQGPQGPVHRAAP